MNNKYRLYISVLLIISVMSLSIIPLEPIKNVNDSDWVMLGVFIGVLVAIALQALYAVMQESMEDDNSEYEQTFQVELYDWAKEDNHTEWEGK